MKIVVLQTCVPDYRVGFFNALSLEFPSLLVYAGAEYYDPSIKTANYVARWCRSVENHFILRRRALWQKLPLSLIFYEGVVIAELNPRSLSSWMLVLIRLVVRMPTVFWGHAWARSGMSSSVVGVRLLMWRLASARIVYTCSQVTELRKVLPGPIFPAKNALYSEATVRSRGDRDRQRFIYVGRLVPEKRPDLLIRALGLLANGNFALSIDIVGDGPEREALQVLANELGVEKNVRFYGHISDQTLLAEIYDEAIAALSPGYVGLSATQAFFFGVPMIVADGEAHSPEIEACREGFNTVFFKAGDAYSLSVAIEWVYMERRRWREEANKIQRDVCNRYSIEKMVKCFEMAASACQLYGGGVI